MKKKIALIQMNVALGDIEKNYTHAEELMTKAATEGTDILVLPETWNTGFFPKENLKELADAEGKRTKAFLSAFAKKHTLYIMGGSVSTLREGKIYNTSYTVNREGEIINEYTKIHGFSPSGEPDFYTGGTQINTFTIDGITCATIVCYDLRFCELVRLLAIHGVDLLFVPAHWPLIRKHHWVTLNTARAIENQFFLCAVNACGKAEDTQYGGNSLLLDPWGETLCHLGENEEIAHGTIDLDILKDIRERIHVFRDRRPELYKELL